MCKSPSRPFRLRRTYHYPQYSVIHILLSDYILLFLFLFPFFFFLGQLNNEHSVLAFGAERRLFFPFSYFLGFLLSGFLSFSFPLLVPGVLGRWHS